jgi:DNA polymerase II small subunit/DNA polymerase delta subunit B
MVGRGKARWGVFTFERQAMDYEGKIKQIEADLDKREAAAREALRNIEQERKWLGKLKALQPQDEIYTQAVALMPTKYRDKRERVAKVVVDMRRQGKSLEEIANKVRPLAGLSSKTIVKDIKFLRVIADLVDGVTVNAERINNAD